MSNLNDLKIQAIAVHRAFGLAAGWSEDEIDGEMRWIQKDLERKTEAELKAFIAEYQESMHLIKPDATLSAPSSAPPHRVSDPEPPPPPLSVARGVDNDDFTSNTRRYPTREEANKRHADDMARRRREAEATLDRYAKEDKERSEREKAEREKAEAKAAERAEIKKRAEAARAARERRQAEFASQTQLYAELRHPALDGVILQIKTPRMQEPEAKELLSSLKRFASDNDFLIQSVDRDKEQFYYTIDGLSDLATWILSDEMRNNIKRADEAKADDFFTASLTHPDFQSEHASEGFLIYGSPYNTRAGEDRIFADTLTVSIHGLELFKDCQQYAEESGWVLKRTFGGGAFKQVMGIEQFDEILQLRSEKPPTPPKDPHFIKGANDIR